MYYPHFSYPTYPHYSKPYGFHGLAHAHGCCDDLVKEVVCIEHCDDKILFVVNGLFSELAQNNCFKLVLCQKKLENNSELPVFLTDRCAIFPLVEGCSVNMVHYAQMVELVNHRRFACGRPIVLNCYYGNNGVPGYELHVACNSKLPRSTFVPMPAPTI